MRRCGVLRLVRNGAYDGVRAMLLEEHAASRSGGGLGRANWSTRRRAGFKNDRSAEVRFSKSCPYFRAKGGQ